jgi:CRP-like cAMP-binding protein
MGTPAPKMSRPLASKPASGPQMIQLKKGQVLFREGDRSRAMYILKEGSLRLYKKKGQASIELAVIHRGEVIGELAFFDGEARSASAEALSACELIMISFEQMSRQLNTLPPWLKSLIQSVVKRLRSTTTKVKQLEKSSLQYGDGLASSYQYLSFTDAVRMLAALVLSVYRYGRETGDGNTYVNPDQYHYMVSQIFSTPTSKIMDFLDLLQEEEFLRLEKADEQSWIIVHKVDLLDGAMNFISKENSLDDSKRFKATRPSVKLFRAIYHSIKRMKEDEKQEKVNVSITQAVSKMYGPKEVDNLVQNELFAEVVRKGWAKPMMTREGQVTADIDLKRFKLAIPSICLMRSISELNEKKRENV